MSDIFFLLILCIAAVLLIAWILSTLNRFSAKIHAKAHRAYFLVRWWLIGNYTIKKFNKGLKRETARQRELPPALLCKTKFCEKMEKTARRSYTYYLDTPLAPAVWAFDFIKKGVWGD